ncbi:YeeE/YedE thiosulfate transporter family protein [Geobacter sp. DSM 9736]|uniref:YeeE/YedE thiosulfate transporter family protein n=1 Tax=Geobacter sp. DSM 9736 TaxID=1277350 RepID=UPI000B508115|nr:YeeE/YedE thiosulfate transporter family protein [Geobacter sp. DSM 9736]SNB46906.1 hypothetical protein SAMN06269301_2378 [Geobacter sp. DSM 9736]
MLDDPAKLLLGLLTGIVFGFLLQKGQVAKFHVILGQLLLKDWTVVKIMGTAVAVGTIGVNILVATGLASLHIQTASVGRVVGGGILFGIGMAIFGLCPGTSVAASGEGHRDAMVGVLGMLCGAALYVALFPWLQPLFKALPDYGKVTLPQATGTTTSLWAGGVALIFATGLILLRVRGSQLHPKR